MCNLYTYRVMPEEMAGLIAHFKLIGRQFAEVVRMKSDSVRLRQCATF